MKNIVSIIKTVVILSFFLSISLSTFAQGGPPPPPPGGGHGQITDQPPVGGNAPIGGGLAILLGLGAAYGARKVISERTREV